MQWMWKHNTYWGKHHRKRVRWSINSLRWRHNGRDSVSNHQPYDCLLNYLYRRRSKKTSKLRVTGLCVGNSPGTGEFTAQMASNAENVSIWWRHHVARKTRIFGNRHFELHFHEKNILFFATKFTSSHICCQPESLLLTDLGGDFSIEKHHYSDVIMDTMASLITSLTSVYSTVHPGADQRKHQSSASLSFVREFTGDRI